MIVMQVLEQIKRRMRINSVQCVLDLERYAIGGGISARKEVTDSIRKGIDKLFSSGFLFPSPSRKS
jgi:hypothetical protein